MPDSSSPAWFAGRYVLQDSQYLNPVEPESTCAVFACIPEMLPYSFNSPIASYFVASPSCGGTAQYQFLIDKWCDYDQGDTRSENVEGPGSIDDVTGVWTYTPGLIDSGQSFSLRVAAHQWACDEVRLSKAARQLTLPSTSRRK